MGLFKKNKPKERMDINFQEGTIKVNGLVIDKNCTEQLLTQLPGFYKQMDEKLQSPIYRGNADVYWEGHRFDAVTIRFRHDKATDTLKIWDVIIRREQSADAPDFCKMLRTALGKKGAGDENTYSGKCNETLYIATNSASRASLSISFEDLVSPVRY